MINSTTTKIVGSKIANTKCHSAVTYCTFKPGSLFWTKHTIADSFLGKRDERNDQVINETIEGTSAASFLMTARERRMYTFFQRLWNGQDWGGNRGGDDFLDKTSTLALTKSDLTTTNKITPRTQPKITNFSTYAIASTTAKIPTTPPEP